MYRPYDIFSNDLTKCLVKLSIDQTLATIDQTHFVRRPRHNCSLIIIELILLNSDGTK